MARKRHKKKKAKKRAALADFEDKELLWQAQIGRMGRMALFRGRVWIDTVVLKHLRSRPSGKYVDDHVWLLGGPWVSGIQRGARVEFQATVYSYDGGSSYGLWGQRKLRFV